MENKEIKLELKNISKHFKGVYANKNVNINLYKGEILSILGENGSGKSTLLRCMNLLEKPTFGEVWMDDKLLTPVDPYLHKEVIKESNTYKKLIESGLKEDEAIKKIKDEDLLNEKNDGKEYKKAIKKYQFSTKI